MAALAMLEDLVNGRIRREEIFRHPPDLLANDEWRIGQFRLPRTVLLDLRKKQKPNRACPTSSPYTFQRQLADRSGIFQPTFSHILPDMLGGIK